MSNIKIELSTTKQVKTIDTKTVVKYSQVPLWMFGSAVCPICKWQIEDQEDCVRVLCSDRSLFTLHTNCFNTAMQKSVAAQINDTEEEIKIQTAKEILWDAYSRLNESCRMTIVHNLGPDNFRPSGWKSWKEYFNLLIEDRRGAELWHEVKSRTPADAKFKLTGNCPF